MTLRNDPSYLFTLRFKLDSNTTLIAHAFDGGFQDPNHTRIDVAATLVKTRGEIVTRSTLWVRGDTWCGIPQHKTVDGDDAKECVTTLLAMKPGDTDSDYFEGWTEEQLCFAERYGEELRVIALDRYGER